MNGYVPLATPSMDGNLMTLTQQRLCRVVNRGASSVRNSFTMQPVRVLILRDFFEIRTLRRL